MANNLRYNNELLNTASGVQKSLSTSAMAAASKENTKEE